MLANIIAFLVIGIYFLSVLYVIYGHKLVMLIPTITKLHQVKESLSNTALNKGIAKGTTFMLFCSRLLIEYLPQNSTLNKYGNRTMGDVVEIVHYRERALRRIIKELQIYSFLLTILGMLGLFKSLSQSKFIFSIQKIWKTAGENPFDLLALFEFTMVFLIGFRLIIELMTIKELLED